MNLSDLLRLLGSQVRDVACDVEAIYKTSPPLRSTQAFWTTTDGHAKAVARWYEKRALLR